MADYLIPISTTRRPVFDNIFRRKIQDFAQGIVVREGRLVLGNFAELPVESLNDVCCIYDFPNLGWTTIHNNIDIEHGILRKGAISAQKGERVLIPINMRDGSLLCTGKGNPGWNWSAPHGAGRLMSRRQAKDSITLPQYKETIRGIYSSTVNKSTIDEAPFRL